MSFLNRIVDKVYVINLKKDTEKMENAKKEFDNQHIVYERFDAVLGREVKSDPRITNDCNFYCADGVKGCALSHKTIWENALKKNYESIAIFEDDVLFNRDFNTVLQLNYKDVPTDFDILYLGASLDCGDKSTYNRFNEYTNSVRNERITDNLLKVNGCAGTYGYIVSKKGMQAIKDELVTMHIDINIREWTKKHNLKVYAFHPVLVTQDVANSGLSSSFPPLLNTLLSQIDITDQPHNHTLSWILNECGYQYFGIKECSLMKIALILPLFIPLKYYYMLYVWLLVEFLASFNFKYTLVYGLILSIPYFIKYIFIKY